MVAEFRIMDFVPPRFKDMVCFDCDSLSPTVFAFELPVMAHCSQQFQYAKSVLEKWGKEIDKATNLSFMNVTTRSIIADDAVKSGAFVRPAKVFINFRMARLEVKPYGVSQTEFDALKKAITNMLWPSLEAIAELPELSKGIPFPKGAKDVLCVRTNWNWAQAEEQSYKIRRALLRVFDEFDFDFSTTFSFETGEMMFIGEWQQEVTQATRKQLRDKCLKVLEATYDLREIVLDERNVFVMYWVIDPFTVSR